MTENRPSFTANIAFGPVLRFFKTDFVFQELKTPATAATISSAVTHQRWPKNYTELSPLVEQTDGKAQARQYDRVDLTELPDGSLEIYSVVHGQTNRITLPFKETNAK